MTASLNGTDTSSHADARLRPSAGVRVRMKANGRRAGACLLVAAAAVLMSACGGRAGSDGDPQYDVKTATGHWLNDAGSWALKGTAPGGQSYTLNLATAPLAQATAPIVGGTAARSQQTYTADIDGAKVDGSLMYYFDASTLSFIATDNGTGSCDVTQSNTALPSGALTGEGGAMYTDSVYDGCASGAKVIAAAEGDWSLQSRSGVVMLCWKLTAKDLAGAELATQSTCIEVAPDGTLGSKASLVATVSGTTILDARNF